MNGTVDDETVGRFEMSEVDPYFISHLQTASRIINPNGWKQTCQNLAVHALALTNQLTPYGFKLELREIPHHLLHVLR